MGVQLCITITNTHGSWLDEGLNRSTSRCYAVCRSRFVFWPCCEPFHLDLAGQRFPLLSGRSGGTPFIGRSEVLVRFPVAWPVPCGVSCPIPFPMAHDVSIMAMAFPMAMTFPMAHGIRCGISYVHGHFCFPLRFLWHFYYGHDNF